MTSSSSSTVGIRTKSSTDQRSEISETIIESKNKVNIFSQNKKEKTDNQSLHHHHHHLKTPQSPDGSSNHSSHSKKKRSIFSFGFPPVQSSLLSHSHKKSSHIILQAKPFDEFVIGPSNLDIQNEIPIKPDGSNIPRTDKTT